MRKILLLGSGLGVSVLLSSLALSHDLVVMDTPPVELSYNFTQPFELSVFENSLQFVDSHLFEWTVSIPYHFREDINQTFENRLNVKAYRSDQLIFYYNYRLRADIT